MVGGMETLFAPPIQQGGKERVGDRGERKMGRESRNGQKKRDGKREEEKQRVREVERKRVTGM